MVPSLVAELCELERIELESAGCEWIDKCENVIVLETSGVGKTHTALVLGLAVFHKGHSGAFITAAALVS